MNSPFDDVEKKKLLVKSLHP